MKPARFSVGNHVELNYEPTTLAFIESMILFGERLEDLRQIFVVEDTKYYPSVDQWMIRIGSARWAAETWVSENFFQLAAPASTMH